MGQKPIRNFFFFMNIYPPSVPSSHDALGPVNCDAILKNPPLIG